MSVQVQLRRDTLANVLANHGALGEVFVSTDTSRMARRLVASRQTEHRPRERRRR
jgi:hypothetical protein